MVRTMMAVLALAGLGGCASVNNKVVLPGGDTAGPLALTDATGADTYPGFLVAEGNIYSCRYGIHHQSREEFVPDKARTFAVLLKNAAPGLDLRRVVLERFDVYHNYRLKALSRVGQGAGGVIGDALVRAGRVNEDVFTFDKLIIDPRPGQSRHEGENVVGCDDRQEGDYYASQISGGHDVIVTWLGFRVDDTPYLIKSYYQFQPETKPQVVQAIGDAMRMTVAGAASRLAPSS
jgi:hypothetical protein